MIEAPTAQGLANAVAALRAGALVILPTETVYGLAVDAANAAAVARVYEAKGRPRFNPLIAHVNDGEAARTLALFDARANALAQAFWPGPLTLVLPRAPTCPVALLACAGLDTIAVRVPAHPVMRQVLAAFGGAIAAPSANRSGRLSPTTAAAAEAELGAQVALTLDGGPCAVGLESTIVFLAPNQPATLLRPGGVARQRIEALIGPLAAAGEGVQAPGMLASHYAPSAALRLNARAPRVGEAFLAFGPNAPAGALNLSAAGDLAQAAANLFDHLRRLDAAGVQTIAVAPIPDHGLGEAINDRLARAAAPR